MYLEQSSTEKWVESAYEAEGPLYWATMSILLHSPSKWAENRVGHLRKLLVIAQVRYCHPVGPNKTLTEKSVKEYNVYKPYLIFFGLIDGIYKNFFKVGVKGMQKCLFYFSFVSEC